MYWKTQAAHLPTGNLDHPWATLLRNAIRRIRPGMFTTLIEIDELDSYLLVKTTEALAEYERLLADDVDEDTAKELVFQDFFPIAEDEMLIEEYEDEGGQEEQIAAFEAFINKMPISQPAK